MWAAAMADNAKKIAELEKIVQGATSRVTTDGTSTEFDLSAARAELRRLREQDDSQKGRRPVISSINLSNF